MDLVQSILLKSAAILIAAISLPIIFYLLRRAFGGKLKLLLPFCVYVGVAAASLYFGYPVIAAVIFILGVFLHIILFYGASYFLDRKRFKSLSEEDIWGLASFLSDRRVRFFKKEAEIIFARKIGQWIRFMQCLERGTDREIFSVIYLILEEYFHSNYTPVNLSLKSNFNRHDINVRIRTYKNADAWVKSKELAQAKLSSLKSSLEQAENSEGSQQDIEELRKSVLEAQEYLLSLHTSELAGRNISEISEYDHLIQAFEERAADLLKQMISRFIPDFILNYVENDGATKPKFLIGLQIDPAEIENFMIWERKFGTPNAAAQAGYAVVAPKIKSMHVAIDAHVRDVWIRYSNVSDFFLDWAKIKSFNSYGYKVILVESMMGFIKLALLEAFSISGSNKKPEEKKSEVGNSALFALMSKVSRDIEGELRSKSEENAEEVLNRINKGSVITHTSLGAALTDDQARRVFEKNRGDIEKYFATIEADMNKMVETSIASFSAIEIPLPSLDNN